MSQALERDQFVWGVDIGVKVVTWCAIRPGRKPRWLQVRGVERGSIAERLSLLGGEVRHGAINLSETHSPACVMVEQPIAAGRTNAHLLWACGVITVALHEALAGLNPHPTPIWHCPVTAWKKSTVGKGNAGKPEVHDWATEQTGASLDFDEADAYGIARHTLKALEVS